jgi:hypothetical protein
MPRIRQFLGNYNLCWKECDREILDCKTMQDGLPIVAVPGHITNAGGIRQDGKWVEYATTYGKMLDIATEEEGWNDNLQFVEGWGCFILMEGDDCPDIPNDDVEITTTCGG